MKQGSNEVTKQDELRYHGFATGTAFGARFVVD
jgi:hypothetical protein